MSYNLFKELELRVADKIEPLDRIICVIRNNNIDGRIVLFFLSQIGSLLFCISWGHHPNSRAPSKKSPSNFRASLEGQWSHTPCSSCF